MFSRAAVAMLFGLCAACAAVPSYEAEPMQEYVLEPAIKPAASVLPSEITIAVAEPRPRPGFGTSAMIYQERDFALNEFARNRWVESPARMLGPLIVQALEASGRFAAVSSTVTPAQAHWRLDTSDVRLLQTFGGDESHVELSLQATLTDTAGREILFSRKLSTRVAAPTADPYGGVQAANRAAAALLRELVGLCAGQLPAREMNE